MSLTRLATATIPDMEILTSKYLRVTSRTTDMCCEILFKNEELDIIFGSLFLFSAFMGFIFMSIVCFMLLLVHTYIVLEK